MTNIFKMFEQRIKKYVEALDLPGIELSLLQRVAVELPRDPVHGDLATNAAMILAKPAGVNPREIAAKLVDAIAADDDVASAEVAGPGFINIRLVDGFWRCHLSDILDAGCEYGGGETGKGLKVNVEYVSANPTGPMHVGHCRGAVVGDALANLLGLPATMSRANITSTMPAGRSTCWRGRFSTLPRGLGEDIGDIPEGLYPGDYLVPVGKKLADQHGDKLLAMDESEWLPIVKDASIDAMMGLIRGDLAALGVEHDVFFSERDLHRQKGNSSRFPKQFQRWRMPGWSIPARYRRPRASRTMTGKTANNCCSAPPMLAMTWIAR